MSCAACYDGCALFELSYDDMILLLLYKGANLSEKWGDGPEQ